MCSLSVMSSYVIFSGEKYLLSRMIQHISFRTTSAHFSLCFQASWLTTETSFNILCLTSQLQNRGDTYLPLYKHALCLLIESRT